MERRSATRSASGPMEAPQVPAPISLGAPISETRLFMANPLSSLAHAGLCALPQGTAEEILRIIEFGYQVDLPCSAALFLQQRMEKTQGGIVLERKPDGIE